MLKIFAQLCGYVAGTLALMGCHYDEEQAWRECCRLVVAPEDTSSPAAQKTIVDWVLLGMRFDGEDRPSAEAMRIRKPAISTAYSKYLANNPGAVMSAYFASLGMTCKATGVPKADMARCEIDFPVTARCLSLNVFYPFGLPVPKELRQPFPAVLHMAVDVTTSDLLDTHSEIRPITGGRLCRRKASLPLDH